MSRYFGTDGFRGEVNCTLNAEHAFAIGRFLGWYYGRNKQTAPKILIGRDTRRSGILLESALVSGLTSSGANAWLLHVTTTPSVAYLTRKEGFDCGVMISASHNPYYDNGIKLISAAGEKMDEATIALIEDYIDGKTTIPLAKRDEIGETVDYSAGRDQYAQALSALVPAFPGLRIGLDCANGSASHLAKQVFDSLGVETYVINDAPDGLNINRDAGSTHIESLQKFVVEKGLDAGFAFDGDADRCLCVDETGTVLTGDHILYICSKYLHARGELSENTVVTTVMSNFGLYRALDELGISYAKTAVGDKYVYEYMKTNGCCLGGEQSGHIIFSRHASTGDGILTALMMTQVMFAQKKTLHALSQGFTVFPQVLTNVRVADKQTAMADPDVCRAIDYAASALGETGRILVRESGTEPVIRVMAEAATTEICQKWVDSIVKTLQEKGHTV